MMDALRRNDAEELARAAREHELLQALASRRFDMSGGITSVDGCSRAGGGSGGVAHTHSSASQGPRGDRRSPMSRFAYAGARQPGAGRQRRGGGRQQAGRRRAADASRVMPTELKAGQGGSASIDCGPCCWRASSWRELVVFSRQMACPDPGRHSPTARHRRAGRRVPASKPLKRALSRLGRISAMAGRCLAPCRPPQGVQQPVRAIIHVGEYRPAGGGLPAARQPLRSGLGPASGSRPPCAIPAS